MPTPISNPTPDSIRAHLDGLHIPYRHLTHGPTLTSEESARARGEPIEVGAKALLIKVDDAFVLLVLSAALKLDSAAVKRRLGARSSRFASREELLHLTGLVPGSVPPFGPPILPFDLYIDSNLPGLPRVAFNCASLTESLILATPDYVRAAAPRDIFPFAAAG